MPFSRYGGREALPLIEFRIVGTIKPTKNLLGPYDA